jgi:DNA adenine methylase
MSVSHSYHYDKIGYGFGYSRQKRTVVYATYFRRLQRLIEIATKLRHAQIECIDGVELMRKFDSSDAFMFVDPPYISSTVRLKEAIYAKEYDDSLHERLLEFVVSAKAKIMIASYPNELYDSLLGRGWFRIDKQKVISAVRISPGESSPRRPKRIESVYINYEPPKSRLLL